MAPAAETQVTPPWGYGLLTSQSAVRATWKAQIFGSIIVGGYYWDTIISLPADFQFIFRRRFNYATALFVVNRVRALYQENMYLLVFMILFLFAGPSFALSEAIKTTAFNLPGDVGCVFGPSSPYIYLIFLLQATFDCLCFVLCTYKLIRIGQGSGFMSIGREMLNGGLIYYIPNVITQIATIIMTLQRGSEDQFLLPPAADGVASAQALRITRRMWRIGQKELLPSSFYSS